MLKKLILGGAPTDGNVLAAIDEELDSTVQMTALLAAQSGGNPVKKVGYFEKRGGIRSRAYKHRFLVLTEYGKCLYFHNATSTQSLGNTKTQFCIFIYT